MKRNFVIAHGQITLITNRQSHNNEYRMYQGSIRGIRSGPFWSTYYEVSNNRGEWNNSVGWKKTVKLIIALVGNVSNNSIGWISTIFIMDLLKVYKRIEKIYKYQIY